MCLINKAILTSQGFFVHAHGTGTPANRTTESHILNEIANFEVLEVDEMNMGARKLSDKI